MMLRRRSAAWQGRVRATRCSSDMRGARYALRVTVAPRSYSRNSGSTWWESEMGRRSDCSAVGDGSLVLGIRE